MRVGFDALSLTQERSGTSNYLSRLIRRLVELDPDLQIVLFAPDKICVDYEPFIRHPRIRRIVVDLPYRERRKWGAKHLPRLLKEHALDLFHQPGGLDTAMFNPPCPTVVTAHDMAPWVLNVFRSWRKALRYRLRTLFWAHRCQHILTGVETSRKDIMRLCRAPQQKIALVPYGVEPMFEGALALQEADDILRKYRLLGKRYIVNLSGLTFKRRNLELVLDGFARFHREVPDDVTLVFTGAIANAQGIFDRAQRRMGMLGIRDRVVVTGFVSEKMLSVILENAEAAIVTSFNEGFPQSMVESFAAGTAVIATDRGGIPEVAGEAAVIIDPYDPQALAEALKRFLGNPVERGLYAEKGYARAREFTWQKTAQATLAVYHTLLK